MASATTANVKRGRLAAEERAQIEALAARKLTAGQIARRLNRIPATINNAMYSMGLKAPSNRPALAAFTRKSGSVVVGFTPDEDTMLETMRVDGRFAREIAEECLARFGRKRSPATINTRLRMLANKDEA
jgi:hypothetical protein